MRHYYSIANFLAGIGIEIYDNYFSSYGETYQQLLGEMLGWSQGHTGEVQAIFNNNVLPELFVNQWGNNLTRTIVKQFKHQYIEYENGNIKGWNGDAAAIMQHTSLWNFMSKWNNVATIVAGVSDVIYQLIDDATSMLELEIMLLVIVGVGAGLVGLVAPINEGVVKGSIAMWIATSLIVINAFLDPFLGVEKINLMYQVGFDFSKLDRYDIAILVNKYGLESLKQLKEVGADFSKFPSWQIGDLVKELGIEIIEFYKIIDDISHYIIEHHIDDSEVEQDTISTIEEVEINNLEGIVTEFNTSSWSEDL